MLTKDGALSLTPLLTTPCSDKLDKEGTGSSGPDYGQGWMALTQLHLHIQQSSGLCENVRIIKCEIHLLQMNIAFSQSDEVTRLGVGTSTPQPVWTNQSSFSGTPTALQNLFFHHTVWGVCTVFL